MPNNNNNNNNDKKNNNDGHKGYVTRRSTTNLLTKRTGKPGVFGAGVPSVSVVAEESYLLNTSNATLILKHPSANAGYHLINEIIMAGLPFHEIGKMALLLGSSGNTKFITKLYSDAEMGALTGIAASVRSWLDGRSRLANTLGAFADSRVAYNVGLTRVVSFHLASQADKDPKADLNCQMAAREDLGLIFQSAFEDLVRVKRDDIVESLSNILSSKVPASDTDVFVADLTDFLVTAFSQTMSTGKGRSGSTVSRKDIVDNYNAYQLCVSLAKVGLIDLVSYCFATTQSSSGNINVGTPLDSKLWDTFLAKFGSEYIGNDWGSDEDMTTLFNSLRVDANRAYQSVNGYMNSVVSTTNALNTLEDAKRIVINFVSDTKSFYDKSFKNSDHLMAEFRLLCSNMTQVGTAEAAAGTLSNFEKTPTFTQSFAGAMWAMLAAAMEMDALAQNEFLDIILDADVISAYNNSSFGELAHLEYNGPVLPAATIVGIGNALTLRPKPNRKIVFSEQGRLASIGDHKVDGALAMIDIKKNSSISNLFSLFCTLAVANPEIRNSIRRGTFRGLSSPYTFNTLAKDAAMNRFNSDESTVVVQLACYKLAVKFWAAEVAMGIADLANITLFRFSRPGTEYEFIPGRDIILPRAEELAASALALAADLTGSSVDAIKGDSTFSPINEITDVYHEKNKSKGAKLSENGKDLLLMDFFASTGKFRQVTEWLRLARELFMMTGDKAYDLPDASNVFSLKDATMQPVFTTLFNGIARTLTAIHPDDTLAMYPNEIEMEQFTNSMLRTSEGVRYSYMVPLKLLSTAALDTSASSASLRPSLIANTKRMNDINTLPPYANSILKRKLHNMLSANYEYTTNYQSRAYRAMEVLGSVVINLLQYSISEMEGAKYGVMPIIETILTTDYSARLNEVLGLVGLSSSTELTAREAGVIVRFVGAMQYEGAFPFKLASKAAEIVTRASKSSDVDGTVVTLGSLLELTGRPAGGSYSSIFSDNTSSVQVVFLRTPEMMKLLFSDTIRIDSYSDTQFVLVQDGRIHEAGSRARGYYLNVQGLIPIHPGTTINDNVVHGTSQQIADSIFDHISLVTGSFNHKKSEEKPVDSDDAVDALTD